VNVLVRMGVDGKSVIDIGGGVGAVQHGLLEAGASQALSVEASGAYDEVAREEAARRGLSDRITHLHGDFVELAESIPAADIVTLDRVICCYPDMRALVGASSQRARRAYGLVYPRSVWWLRPAFALGNMILRLRRSPFRIFLHPTREVEAIAAAHGLRRVFHRLHGVWQVAVFTAG
jgi:magnesium-protoporphyrin O-methyltransferase